MHSMKKAVSLFMLLAVCISALGTSTLAFSETDALENDVKSLDSKEYTESVDFDGIYVSADGQYAMSAPLEISTTSSRQSSEEILIPVERVDIAFSDAQAVDEFISRTDIPDVIINDFQAQYESYLELDIEQQEDTTATFFGVRAGGNPDNIITTTYNGCPMMTHQFFYNNLSTGWKTVKSGAGAKDKAKLVKDVSISLGSLVSKRLTYFSTGKSVFDSFLTYFGLSDNNVTTNGLDYFEARLTWGQKVQYTMRDWAGEWQCGLVTYSVNVRNLAQEQFYANSGKDAYLTEANHNVTVNSAHYASPWKTAYDNGRYTEREYVSWSTGDIRYDFN